ncbi:hypothetical protein TNCV_4693731 [Trichonephila clavipes]|uniref:Uncharacterized protein n=1 Tax=Trichonephila clavipes TaxID=2585209 RepID=A0A8X6WBS8_TRICX|nr:hypothetical protein TNCV_4693731 [Trichonephila clavipes]
MNSPDYEDFIGMFSVPTPISPLPPTPVASPSHEPSQDVIYDSSTPMEQSTVPESPLKDLLPVDSKPSVVSRPPQVSTPVKKVDVKQVDSIIHRGHSPRSRERRNEERRNEKRRNEERRPRNPRLYRRPNFRPRIEGLISNPECFGYSLCTSIDAHLPGKCPCLFSTTKSTYLHDGPNRCLPRAHFNDRDARDTGRETRRIGICSSVLTSIIYQEPNTKLVFVLFCKDNWYQKKTLVDNFKRAIMEAKHVNEFRPDDVLWEKISKGLLRNPDRPPEKHPQEDGVYL